MADHRHARAPPPTPIATGKGLRSAAVDERVLSEFLETLSVPSLTLPDPVLTARSSHHRKPTEVDLPSLVARDEASVRRMLASAAVVGAFRVDGRGVVPAEEVRSAVEAGGAAFRIPEADRREMGGWFGRREGIGEEFYWDWRRSWENEKVLRLREVWPGPGTFRTFSEKMESIASKLEMVAQCIQRILSKHMKNQRHSSGLRRMRSILCLRKYDPNHYGGDQSESKDAKNLLSHTLILHLYGDDHNFSIRCPENSSFGTTGSILVTVDEQVQEWCNDAFKTPSLEIFSESNDPNPPYHLESVCSQITQSSEDLDSIKNITIMDQLLLMLIVTFLYKLCEYISFKLSQT